MYYHSQSCAPTYELHCPVRGQTCPNKSDRSLCVFVMESVPIGVSIGLIYRLLIYDAVLGLDKPALEREKLLLDINMMVLTYCWPRPIVRAISSPLIVRHAG